MISENRINRWPLLCLTLALLAAGSAGSDQEEKSDREKKIDDAAVLVASGDVSRPVLERDGDSFLVGWSAGGASLEQSFSALGQPLGPVLAVPQRDPTPKRRLKLAGGGSAEVVERFKADGDGWAVVLERVDGAGSRLPSLVVNESSQGDQTEPAIASLPAGGFVVVWHGEDPETGDSSLFSRRIGANGLMGQELQVVSSAESILEPAVLGSPAGVAFAWRLESPQGGSLWFRFVGDLIFADDFETGDLTAWSSSEGSPPEAEFLAAPEAGFAALDVSFDASASSSQSADISEWNWQFGDGSSASGEIVNHLYTEPGQFTVQLTVVAEGETDTATSTVTVLPPNVIMSGPLVTVRNQAPPALTLGRASTATVTVRNDTPPASQLNSAASAVVTIRNDIAPGLSNNQAQAPLVTVRNDGEP